MLVSADIPEDEPVDSVRLSKWAERDSISMLSSTELLVAALDMVLTTPLELRRASISCSSFFTFWKIKKEPPKPLQNTGDQEK